MRKLLIPVNNQNGSMILIALLLLVILTLMGVTSTRTSITENRIAVNEQTQKMAFYQAEAGINTSAQLIELVFENDLEPISDTDFEFVYLIDESNTDENDTDASDFYQIIRRQKDEFKGKPLIALTLQHGDARTAIYEVSYQDHYGIGGGQMFDAGGGAGSGVVEEEYIFRILSESESLRRSKSFISAQFIKVDY